MFDADKQHKKITPSKSKTHAVVETFSPRVILILSCSRPKLRVLPVFEPQN
jgi:hypothetical protein